ncbi:MAG: alpha/beta fold hydrolase [Candidatus Promineifilaceae bacterium]
MRPRTTFVSLITVLLLLVAFAPAAAASVNPVSNDDTGAMILGLSMVADPATLSAAQFVSVPPFGTPHGVVDALSFFPTHEASAAILTSGNVLYADDENTSNSTGDAIGGDPVAGRGNTAFDVTVLELTLQAPAEANCLRLDFAFYSDEFPEFVGTIYNDAFIAEMDQSTWTADFTIEAPNNFAFDPEGEVISVNSSGATSMNELNAAATTYDGATVLLEAATQVTPGEHLLYLSIFDQGDHVYDSAVFVDNVRFESVADPDTQCRPGAEPQARTPLILLPGIGGSELHNDSGEAWPRAQELFDDDQDEFFLVLRLAEDGSSPFDSSDPDYTTMDVGGVLGNRTIHDVFLGFDHTVDFYATTFDKLEEAGYQINLDLFAFPYDWRKSVRQSADDLIAYIDLVRLLTGAEQVDLMGHSLGGIVARVALADPDSSGKVRRALTLGSPVLGAAKMLGILEYQTPCFVEAPVLGCRSNSEVVQQTVTNFPSVYQILPGPAYDTAEVPPLTIDRDTSGDGADEGDQHYPQWSAIVSANRNAGLMAENLAFHTTYDDLTLADSSVTFYRIVGDSNDTPLQIREYNDCLIFDWSCEVAYEVVKGNGDGTVSLHSADLFNPDTGFDFRNGLPNAYAHDVGHGDLVKDDEVMDFVISFFGTTPDALANVLQYAMQPVQPRDGSPPPDSPILFQGLSDTPEPFSGIELESLGPVDGIVVDGAGSVLGRFPGQASDAIYELIPGGNFEAIGQTQSFFLNADGAYTATLQATAAGGLRLRVRTYANDLLDGQAVFQVNAGVGTILQLTFVSGQDLNALVLLVDLEGDGLVDIQQPPDSVVVGAGAADTASPVTTADLHLSGGQCQLTLAATDESGGSGVAAIYYRLDGETTTQVYSGPLTFACGSKLEFMAVDRAGNAEAIQTLQTVAIDIKPGPPPNPINLDLPGMTPVALISSATFDATTLGTAGLTLAGAPVAFRPNGTPMVSQEDVNQDGRLDLVIQVTTALLQLDSAAVEAILAGMTAAAVPVLGVDSVVIVP